MQEQKENTPSNTPLHSAVVFTLEEENITSQDDWEAAPHDWQEPEEETTNSDIPNTNNDIMNEHTDNQQPIDHTWVDHIPPLSDEPTEQNDMTPTESTTTKAEQLTETNHTSTDTANTIEPAESDFSLKLELEQDPAPDTVLETESEANTTHFSLDLHESDDEEQNNDTHKRETLAERAAELSDNSLAARIAGLHSADALLEQQEKEQQEETNQSETDKREATKEETEYGRLRYLQHLLGEHNDTCFSSDLDEYGNEDFSILLQEDWLNAQNAIQSERDSEFLLPVQSVVLDTQTNNSPNVPEITVHIYHIPDLPIGKRVKILSEAAMVSGIRARLRPHLANAVAGLASRVLQKKIANLSYELQMMLNEEVPQIVEEILDHNLDEIIRDIKQSSQTDTSEHYTTVSEEPNTDE